MGYYRAGGALTDALVATLKPFTGPAAFGGGHEGTSSDPGLVQGLAQDAIDALTGKKQSSLGPTSSHGPAHLGRSVYERNAPGDAPRRRMNPGNIRALRRGMRRIQSFAKLAHKTISFTHRTKLRKHRRR